MDKAINEIKNQIPSAYLVKCKWFEYLSISDNVNQKDVIRVHKNNMKKARECHAYHNRLIDFILSGFK